jgi:hypothetical protein
MKSFNLGTVVTERLKQVFALTVVIVFGIILSMVAERVNKEQATRSVLEAPAKLP